MRIVRDFSGKPKSINSDLLNILLENNYVPVICVPIVDENNYAINSENDDIIAVIQSELKADKIISLIEAPGFLENPEDENSVVKIMSKDELTKREEEVDGRMKRKVLALRKLFENSDTTVIISDGRSENPITDAMNGTGTTIS